MNTSLKNLNTYATNLTETNQSRIHCKPESTLKHKSSQIVRAPKRVPATYHPESESLGPIWYRYAPPICQAVVL
jgi:hypothetical protein